MENDKVEAGTKQEPLSIDKLTEAEILTTETESTEEEPSFSWRREILSFGREFLIALVFSILITQFVFIIPLVPTGSMIPTINIDERILVDKLTQRFMPVKRGDIVVFPCPDTPEELYVKRVVGMPGDKVEIYSETVFINDEPLDEPYLVVETYGNYGPYYVPQGHIFVMGDNRNNSQDSRSWSDSFVTRDMILGKLYVEIYPNQRFLG